MLQIFAIINASSVMYSEKKAQHDFPKMRGGGIKGRLELFQKFIRFGRAALPLCLMFNTAVTAMVVTAANWTTAQIASIDTHLKFLWWYKSFSQLRQIFVENIQNPSI